MEGKSGDDVQNSDANDVEKIDSLNSSLDVTSPDFDPVEALRAPRLPLGGSTENLRVFDNLAQYESYVRRGGTSFDASEEKREREAQAAAREEKKAVAAALLQDVSSKLL